MNLSRRGFLGSVACAFAVARIGCTIPANATLLDAPNSRGRFVWACETSEFGSNWNNLLAYAFQVRDGEKFYRGDVCRIDETGYLVHVKPDEAYKFRYVALSCEIEQ